METESIIRAWLNERFDGPIQLLCHFPPSQTGVPDIGKALNASASLIRKGNTSYTTAGAREFVVCFHLGPFLFGYHVRASRLSFPSVLSAFNYTLEKEEVSELLKVTTQPIFVAAHGTFVSLTVTVEEGIKDEHLCARIERMFWVNGDYVEEVFDVMEQLAKQDARPKNAEIKPAPDLDGYIHTHEVFGFEAGILVMGMEETIETGCPVYLSVSAC